MWNIRISHRLFCFLTSILCSQGMSKISASNPNSLMWEVQHGRVSQRWNPAPPREILGFTRSQARLLWFIKAVQRERAAVCAWLETRGLRPPHPSRRRTIRLFSQRVLALHSSDTARSDWRSVYRLVSTSKTAGSSRTFKIKLTDSYFALSWLWVRRLARFWCLSPTSLSLVRNHDPVTEDNPQTLLWASTCSWWV